MGHRVFVAIKMGCLFMVMKIGHHVLRVIKMCHRFLMGDENGSSVLHGDYMGHRVFTGDEEMGHRVSMMMKMGHPVSP